MSWPARAKSCGAKSVAGAMRDAAPCEFSTTTREQRVVVAVLLPSMNIGKNARNSSQVGNQRQPAKPAEQHLVLEHFAGQRGLRDSAAPKVADVRADPGHAAGQEAVANVLQRRIDMVSAARRNAPRSLAPSATGRRRADNAPSRRRDRFCERIRISDRIVGRRSSAICIQFCTRSAHAASARSSTSPPSPASRMIARCASCSCRRISGNC